MINFKTPKLIQIYKVSKGKLSFVCSCGRLASVPIKQYSKNLRCKDCTQVNTEMSIYTHFLPMSDIELNELFIKFYDNGLLTFVEEKSVK